MSDLLNKSLSDIEQQRNPRRSNYGGGRGRERNTPYSRPTDSAGDGKWKHDMYGPTRESIEGRPEKSLVIRNLHYEVTEAELKHLFSQIGPLEFGPKIIFDASGRSKGIAGVAYEVKSHAIEALGEFNGAMAKGQRIQITYGRLRERGYRNSESNGKPGRLAAAGKDLASRMSGAADILSSIGDDKPVRGKGSTRAPSSSAPTGPRRPGPVRSSSGAGRGGREDRGRGGRGDRGPPRTADDLDSELEAFMKAPPSKNMSESIHAVKEADGDVAMS